ncbi:MAG TPA: hydrogenase maturation protease [Planctomycetes bacterium]|nr:hydrogenase maturation protease [Planctomycetota bacterium]
MRAVSAGRRGRGAMAAAEKAPILVLGIGNILLRDEGAGVRAIEALSAAALPPGVETLDGGTSGADLLDVIAGRRRLIVVDAVDADAAPGTIVRFTPEELAADPARTVSLHEFGLLETLAAARLLGCAPDDVVVIGVQPKDVHAGLALSEEVAAALPRAVAAVVAEIAR